MPKNRVEEGILWDFQKIFMGRQQLLTNMRWLPFRRQRSSTLDAITGGVKQNRDVLHLTKGKKLRVRAIKHYPKERLAISMEELYYPSHVAIGLLPSLRR